MVVSTVSFREPEFDWLNLRNACSRQAEAFPYFAALALPALLDSGRGSMVTERATLAVPVFQP